MFECLGPQSRGPMSPPRDPPPAGPKRFWGVGFKSEPECPLWSMHATIETGTRTGTEHLGQKGQGKEVGGHCCAVQYR